MRFLFLFVWLCCFLTPNAGAASFFADEDPDAKPWQEGDVALPAPPREESLLPLYVSATTQNRFFVDAASLSVAGDGVVRFVLVVLSGEGGRNVSFEGMRCETKERRIYAVGRADGSWSKARSGDWSRIRDAVANRHYATLFLEYFCPGGVVVQTAAEAVDALRRGGHPAVKHW